MWWVRSWRTLSQPNPQPNKSIKSQEEGAKLQFAYEIPDSAAVDEEQERRKKHHIGITYTYLLKQSPVKGC